MLLRSLVSLALVTLVSSARADVPPEPIGDPPSDGAKAPDPATDAPSDAAQPTEAEQMAALKKALGAIEGPSKAAPLGTVATLDVPAGFWFIPKEGTPGFDQLIENIHDPKSVGVLVKGDMDSVIYFSFDPIGYVKDDERDLDADELLSGMREGATQQNETRKSLGYAPIELLGWVKEPFYNDKTQSLEWALSFREAGAQGEGTANYNTRRLGREGVMSVTLATAPTKVPAAVTEMNAHLAGFNYSAGKDYASFKEGDHMAEIGLGALVAGGGALALAKVGFFKKFWKILAAGGAAVVGLFAKLFGRKKKETDIIAEDDGTPAS